MYLFSFHPQAPPIYLTEQKVRKPDAGDYNIYAKGSLPCSNQEWYHGKLTRVKAEQALAASDCDCFLIRESEGGLVLSLTHHGQVHHVAVKYGPGWYELEGGSAQHRFAELDDLVSFYHRNAITRNLKITLGLSCPRIKPSQSVSAGMFVPYASILGEGEREGKMNALADSKPHPFLFVKRGILKNITHPRLEPVNEANTLIPVHKNRGTGDEAMGKSILSRM